MPQEKKEAIAKAPERRPTRTPIGTRNVLTVKGKDPNYHYRLVNDESDRVQAFLDNGWEIEKVENVRIGDKRLGNPTAEGSAAVASVGRGMHAYVLKIRKEWYEEDQAAKAAQIDASEAATKAEALSNGNYGKIEFPRD